MLGEGMESLVMFPSFGASETQSSRMVTLLFFNVKFHSSAMSGDTIQVTFLRLRSGNGTLQQLRLRSPWDVSSIRVNDKTWPVSGMAICKKMASTNC